MRLGLDVIMVRAWMRASSYVLRNGCYYALCMFVQGCAGHRMRSGMDVSMVWAWMRRSWYALRKGCYYGLGMDVHYLEHERYYGLGMDALLIAFTGARTYYGLGMDARVMLCARELTLLWFGHGCSLVAVTRTRTQFPPHFPKTTHTHPARVGCVARRNIHRAPITR